MRLTLEEMVDERFSEEMACQEETLATPTKQARAARVDGSRSVATNGTQKAEFGGSHAVCSQHGRCEILPGDLDGKGGSRARRRVAMRAV